VLMTLGGTGPRIRAGVTYVVVSVVSSVLFLIAIAILFGCSPIASAQPARSTPLPTRRWPSSR